MDYDKSHQVFHLIFSIAIVGPISSIFRIFRVELDQKHASWLELDYTPFIFIILFEQIFWDTSRFKFFEVSYRKCRLTIGCLVFQSNIIQQ